MYNSITHGRTEIIIEHLSLICSWCVGNVHRSHWCVQDKKEHGVTQWLPEEYDFCIFQEVFFDAPTYSYVMCGHNSVPLKNSQKRIVQLRTSSFKRKQRTSGSPWVFAEMCRRKKLPVMIPHDEENFDEHWWSMHQSGFHSMWSIMISMIIRSDQSNNVIGGEIKYMITCSTLNMLCIFHVIIHEHLLGWCRYV